MSFSKTLIIGISGKKQSGKDTTCDALYKDIMERGYSSDDCHFYSFADELKQKVCIDSLGLTSDQCFGTDEQKNSLTSYRWEKLPREIRIKNHRGIIRASNGEICEYTLPTGYMTAREVMQVVGTDIFRQYFDDYIWINATFREIKKNGHKFALISDVRFPGEVDRIIEEQGYVIRLTRNICESDSHSSEISLDNYDWGKMNNNIVIDNSDMTIDDQNKKVINFFNLIMKDREC